MNNTGSKLYAKLMSAILRVEKIRDDVTGMILLEQIEKKA